MNSERSKFCVPALAMILLPRPPTAKPTAPPPQGRTDSRSSLRILGRTNDRVVAWVQTRILFLGNGLATQPHLTPAQSSRPRTDHDELQIRRRQRLRCQARLTRLGQIGSMPCLFYVPPVGADA